MRPTRWTLPPFRTPAAALALPLALIGLVVAGAGCDDDDDGSIREIRTASALGMQGQDALRVEARSANLHFLQSPDDTLRVVTVKRVEERTSRRVESLLSQIKVTMERQGSTLILRVREPERYTGRVRVNAGPWRHRRSIELELTIAVPSRVRIEAEASRGELSATGLAQAVNLTTTSGDIALSQIQGPVRVQSTSGEVTLRDLAREATVRVTSGDVDAVEVAGPLVIRATSGDLSAQQAHNGVRLETSTGDVEVHGVAGTVMVSTSTGEAEIRDAAADSCVVETASGDIGIGLVRAPRIVQVRSSSGSVMLHMPQGTGGVLDLQTASGTIQVKSAVEVETMSRNRLSGRLGGSGAVAVRTSSGDITLATNEGGGFE